MPDVDRARRSRDVLIVLSVVTLFAVLVGVTVVGVIENWPRHRSIQAGQFRHPEEYDAKVVGLRAVHCQAPSATHCSVVTVKLEGGPAKGTQTSLRFGDSGSAAKVSLGDVVLVYKNPLPPTAVLNGVKVPPYAFSDFERTSPLGWLLAVFAIVVLVAGRLQGLRALLGLGASLATVVYFIVPAIADGRPALQVAAFGALGVMLLTIPLVHGGGAKSVAACLGTGLALLLTLVLADVFTSLAHLTGLTTDEAVYLQATTHVSIRGLLLAGMVVPSLSWTGLVSHATSVGRDHIAATITPWSSPIPAQRYLY